MTIKIEKLLDQEMLNVTCTENSRSTFSEKTNNILENRMSNNHFCSKPGWFLGYTKSVKW